MTKLQGMYQLAIAMLVCVAVGCGGDEPADTTTTTDPAPGTTTAGTDDHDHDHDHDHGEGHTDEDKSATTDPGGTTTSNPPDPQTAEETVQYALHGLQNNNPGVAWQLMPASWQKDVNGLVHEFADRMDPEVWNQSFATLQRTTALLKDKKQAIVQLIAQSQSENPDFDQAAVARDYDGTVALLDTIFKSDLASLEKMKTLDTGELVQQTGGKLMTQMQKLSKLAPGDPFENEFKKNLKDVQIKVISQEADREVLELTFPVTEKSTTTVVDPEDPSNITSSETTSEEKTETKEVAFVKVEDKWVPEDMAKDWDKSMTEARAELENLTPEVIEGFKPQAMAVLQQVNVGLGSLEKTETPEEFAGTALGLFFQFGSMFSQPDVTSPGTDDEVIVVVESKLDDAAAEATELRLAKLADDAELGIAISAPSGAGTEFTIAPVKDINAYAEKLKADYEVKKVDTVTRTITVAPKPAAPGKADPAKPDAAKPDAPKPDAPKLNAPQPEGDSPAEDAPKKDSPAEAKPEAEKAEEAKPETADEKTADPATP